MNQENKIYGAKHLIQNKCGCVYDTLNKATISFCDKHQEEHNRFIEGCL